MHLIDQQLNLMIRGRFDEAWEIAQQIIKEYPNDPRGKFNRGWHLLRQGKFQEGLQLLEYGRSLNVYGDGRINTKKPIWDQKADLYKKTVLIHMEGGYGDHFIHIRFAKEVEKLGGKCIIACHESLHGLYSTVSGVSKCIRKEEIPYTQHDFWIPAFSCSWIFGHTFETLPNDPYMFADPNSVDIWKSILKTDKKIKIGIKWSGNPQFEHQQFRIFPAEKLINLYKDNDHIQFYSLQRDDDIRELPKEIKDLQHFLISWEDTASCIENMDLVISSCTSVAHLASAMGKPTWVIVPILPYHVWAYGDKHSPWYQNTTRIFRQKEFGNWDHPFDEIRQELKNVFPSA